MNAGLMSCARSRSLKSSSAALAVGLALAAAGPLASPACGQGLGATGLWKNPPRSSGAPLGYDWPLRAEFAVHLPNGQILVWKNPNTAQLWNPVNGRFTPVPANGAAAACSGHAALADGSVLVAGGGSPTTGSNKAAIVDAAGKAWQPVAPMAFGRFYPTLTTLGDGRVLVIGGTDNDVTVVFQEIYSPTTETWQTVSFAQGMVAPGPPPGEYPFMFLTTTGTVFYADGDGGDDTWALDLSVPVWLFVTPNFDVGGRPASAVMYSPGRVLKCGGGPGATRDTEFINLNDASPAWSIGPDTVAPRRHHNLVLMPGGRILCIAGQSDIGEEDNPEYRTEWTNPDDLDTPDEKWVLLADIPHFPESMVDHARNNHATAVLLRDATVLSAGDNFDIDEDLIVPTAQIFEPPYLFDANGDYADRPDIGSAPGVISYSSLFTVTLSVTSPVSVGGINKVTLVRLAAVTHDFDQNQRFLSLPFQVATTEEGDSHLAVTAPADGNQAPPGYYMLFVVSNLGVPSVAEYVRLGGSGGGGPNP